MLRPHQELPEAFSGGEPYTSIFLAGTIDMGTGEDWQSGLMDYFSSQPGRYLLFNPRQENWDASRPGEMDYQVNWELELFAKSGKLHVACTPEFYRYDNVRITCSRYGVPLYSSLDEMLQALQ